MVTIVDQESVVKMKIIAGCDGYRASEVVAVIKELGRVPTLDEAFSLAQRLRFGCKRCLVVINAARSKFDRVASPEPLDRIYRRTFHRPRFNPRQDDGKGSHIKIVRV
jgi:hypothetical protein